MKRIICFILITILTMSFMSITAQAENDINVVGDTATIKVTDERCSGQGTTRTTGIVGETLVDLYRSGSGTVVTVEFKVTTAVEGKFNLKVNGARTLAQTFYPVINGVSDTDNAKQFDTYHAMSKYDTITALDTIDFGEINLKAGENTIGLTMGGVSSKVLIHSIKLELKDTPPIISDEFTSSNVKPYKNEDFDFYVNVTDNNISSVSYAVNNGTEKEMSFDDSTNKYKATASCPNVGENTITVKATDDGGFVITKNFIVNCTNYKVDNTAYDVTAEADGTKTKLTAKGRFCNSSDEDMKTCFVIMVYNSNNEMVGFNFENITVSADDEDGRLEVSAYVEDTVGCTVEVAVWDSIVDMNELTSFVYSKAVPTIE